MIRKADPLNSRRRLATIGALTLFLGNCAFAQSEAVESAADQPPVSVIEQLLAAFVDAAQLSDVDARVDFLRGAVLSSHDLDYIGQLTVRRQWREWTEEQRQQFLDAFRELSVMNYAARFSGVGEGSFEVLGTERAGGSRVQVSSTVARSDGSRVPLDFILQSTSDDRWRIANVIADGVSDLALKRAEYSNTLRNSGFEGLIAELEAQTKALAENSAD